jgi:hypothetical protein
LDDLRRIHAMLQEYSGDKVEIKTDEYSFADVDDLANLRVKEINELDLSTYSAKGGIYVTFGKRSCSIRTTSDDMASRAILEGVKSVLASRKSLLGLLVTPPTIMYISLPLCVLGSLPRKIVPVPVALSSMLLMLVVLCISLGSLIKPRYSRVILTNRIDAPTFWERNRDVIVVSTLVGIVCAFAGAWFSAGMAKQAPAPPAIRTSGTGDQIKDPPPAV